MPLFFRFRKKYKVALKKREEIEPEEILLDEEKGNQDNHLERRIETPISRKPFLIFLLGFIFVSLLFLGRTFYFSVANHSLYLSLAKNNIYRTVYKIPERGRIFDRKGVLLAEDVPSFRALIFKRDFPEAKEKREKIFLKVKKILGIKKEEWNDLMNNLNSGEGGETNSYLVLKEDLSTKEASSLAGAKIKGIYVLTSFKRYYPEGNIFSSFVGYVGKPNKEEMNKFNCLPDEMVGKNGLELFYQDILRGQPGKVLISRRAGGNSKGINNKELEIKKALPGQDLHLTIDADFQEYVYKKMMERFSALGIKKGLVVAINPNNGEILAFFNFPSFDNNTLLGNDKKKISSLLNNPLNLFFNKIIQGLYPIGSTIKPFLALKGLEERVVTPETTIDDRPGYISIPNPYFPNRPSIFRDWKIHGLVNLRKALAVSCDVYFYYLGGGFGKFQGLGVKEIDQVLQKFGFDKRTGIDLIGEKGGLIPTPDWKEKAKKQPWRIGDTYHLSIGQGYFLATPIELANAYAILANGGIIYQPHFLEGKTKVLGKVIFNKKDQQEVWKGLVDVCEKPYGTGHILSDLPLKVAGKSGTAQIKGGREINSLFVAAFPAKSPQIIFLAMAENAKEGVLNVLPIVKDSLLWYYKNRIKSHK